MAEKISESGKLMVEKKGPVTRITLNRPEVHNAVNDAVMAGLEAILDRIDEMPEVRALILTGAGERTFCAGGDLKYFASLESQAAGQAIDLGVDEPVVLLAVVELAQPLDCDAPGAVGLVAVADLFQ